MRPTPFAFRFLSRLQATGFTHGGAKVEQVLAVARLFLGCTALIAVRVQPFTPRHYSDLAAFVLLGYTVHSLGLLIRLQFDPDPTPTFVRWGQISDLGWPILLCLFTNPPNSLFYIFFLFALVAAAFRYGFVETMATAVIGIAVLLIQAGIVAFGPNALRDLFRTGIEPPHLIVRCGYLLMTGFLLGLLAETEKELRAEIDLVNRLLSMARVGNKFSETITTVFAELGRVFGSTAVYEIASETRTGRTFRWDIAVRPRVEGHFRELAPDEYSGATADGYPHTFFARRTRNGAHRISAIDDEGRWLDRNQVSQLNIPIDGADSMLSVALDIGREWKARIVMLNAKIGPDQNRELRFLQSIVQQVTPALYSVYLFRRVRSRVGSIERARVARELHDTSIQSLIGIEMQLNVLRRQSETNTEVAGELQRIERLLRDEVQNLRELMQSLRQIDIGPHQFLDFVSQLVERFRRDTGIEVSFVSELEEVSMPPIACQELARVVQESLVNIRKHSGAHSALIRFGFQNGLWKLVVDDDGRGFPFAGRFTLAELDDFRRGPTVIKERVRAVGGDMVIESTPGHGSRLEITVPQKGSALYG